MEFDERILLPSKTSEMFLGARPSIFASIAYAGFARRYHLHLHSRYDVVINDLSVVPLA